MKNGEFQWEDARNDERCHKRTSKRILISAFYRFRNLFFVQPPEASDALMSFAKEMKSEERVEMCNDKICSTGVYL